MSQRKERNMKIEGLFENKDLTIEAVAQEITDDFSFVNLSPEQVLALSKVRLLKKVARLFYEEQDEISGTAADGFSDRAGQLEENENYLSALRLIDGRTGGMDG